MCLAARQTLLDPNNEYLIKPFNLAGPLFNHRFIFFNGPTFDIAAQSPPPKLFSFTSYLFPRKKKRKKEELLIWFRSLQKMQSAILCCKDYNTRVDFSKIVVAQREQRLYFIRFPGYDHSSWKYGDTSNFTSLLGFKTSSYALENRVLC